MCISTQSLIEFAAAVKHPPSDAEMFGGKGFVPASPLEHFYDNTVLKIGKGLVAESEGNVNVHGV